MKSVLKYLLLSAILAIGCASKQEGIDSESHFACKDDADCTAHSANLVCIERICVASKMDASAATHPHDASAMQGTGGGPGIRDARVDPSMKDVHGDPPRPPVLPEAEPPDGMAVDSCDRCIEDLGPARSLECYCNDRRGGIHGTNSCDSSLQEAVKDAQFTSAEYGCGLVALYVLSGAPGGSIQVFERSTGKLVQASTWGDVFDNQCVKPILSQTGDEGVQAGGELTFDVFEGLSAVCSESKSCSLSRGLEEGDSGAAPDAAGPPQPTPCHVSTLLGQSLGDN